MIVWVWLDGCGCVHGYTYVYDSAWFVKQKQQQTNKQKGGGGGMG